MGKKQRSYAFLVFLLILLTSSIAACTPRSEVCFEKKCFFVEKVSTPKEREIGLMNRTSLEEDSGMLFIFEKEDIYAFWMKNTLIPLDMIWINSSNQIAYIYQNATPCEENECPPIIPLQNATYVLEINSGLTNKYNLKLGDRVKI
ncbi:MAG: DUF192 domain-containing protein [Candidatus Nanoarchaeia archaeon]